MPTMTTTGVAGQPKSQDVPAARNQVKDAIVPTWKAPKGVHPRRQRRGG